MHYDFSVSTIVFINSKAKAHKKEGCIALLRENNQAYYKYHIFVLVNFSMLIYIADWITFIRFFYRVINSWKSALATTCIKQGFNVKYSDYSLGWVSLHPRMEHRDTYTTQFFWQEIEHNDHTYTINQIPILSFTVWTCSPPMKTWSKERDFTPTKLHFPKKKKLGSQ